MSGETKAPWHVLEASSVPAIEFAVALNQLVPTIGWIPQMDWRGLSRGFPEPEQIGSPPVSTIRFPLQRGYSHPTMSKLLGMGTRLRDMLLSRTLEPRLSPLVCTSPFFTDTAESWPGPIVYYSLDFTYAYEGLNARQVLDLEKRLCRVAHLVCPVSERIGCYLVEQAGCAPGKIRVLPNAARAANVRHSPKETPDLLPDDIVTMQRPIVGVIGNMADNLDWALLYEILRSEPGFSWLFVGPTSMKIRDRFQSEMRSAVMGIEERVRFLGAKPYGELHKYARAIDVAVMPYRKKEPTYSGSATRFYEHLAACRPILSTWGVAELERKEPLLKLFDSPQQLAQELKALQRSAFRDGLAGARWAESRKETWEQRARAMLEGLESVGLELGPSTTAKAVAATHLT